ncbi:MAG: prolipoprotein diacylglyceryl transferase [Myxococcales bacterium]|nr:prolipoprotein diacylglyceryl transferase [Myxococcales bacterium]
MRPVLVRFDAPLLGDVALPSYFTMLALGFAVALVLTWRDARRQGLAPGRVVDLNLHAVLWGLVGARMLHLIADGQIGVYVATCRAPETLRVLPGVTCTRDAQCAGPRGESGYRCNRRAGHCHPPRDCLLALKLWRGGLSYYGGFIAAALAWLLLIRRWRLPRDRVLDLAGYGLPLGLCFGRIGCFLNGCCYGAMTGSAWGVTFPPGGVVARDHASIPMLGHFAPLPVHPTQLYSAVANLAIFVVCYFVVRPRKRRDGQVLWTFVALYAVSRFAIEFLRADPRGALLGLSTSQLLSVPLLALALFALFRPAARGEAAR